MNEQPPDEQKEKLKQLKYERNILRDFARSMSHRVSKYQKQQRDPDVVRAEKKKRRKAQRASRKRNR